MDGPTGTTRTHCAVNRRAECVLWAIGPLLYSTRPDRLSSELAWRWELMSCRTSDGPARRGVGEELLLARHVVARLRWGGRASRSCGVASTRSRCRDSPARSRPSSTRLHQEIADLRTSLADAERRAAVGIDEDVVLEFLGEESARLLADARSTAQQVRARADEHAARTIAKAESEAHSIRAEAQTYSADVHKAPTNGPRSRRPKPNATPAPSSPRPRRDSDS